MLGPQRNQVTQKGEVKVVWRAVVSGQWLGTQVGAMTPALLILSRELALQGQLRMQLWSPQPPGELPPEMGNFLASGLFPFTMAPEGRSQAHH